MWETAGRPAKFFVLDIGCNDGTLSLALMDHIERELTAYIVEKCVGDVVHVEIQVLGVDVDADLIKRANDSRKAATATTGTTTATATVAKHAEFICYDMMKSVLSHGSDLDSDSDPVRRFLKARNGQGFHFISLFSVTMWVHLNYGDSGLIRLYSIVINLLHRGPISNEAAGFPLVGSILVEPQPWKCYRSAKKRCKSNNLPLPPYCSLVRIKASGRHAQDFFRDVQLPMNANSNSDNNSNLTVIDVNDRCCVLGNESCWGRSMLLFNVHTTDKHVLLHCSRQGECEFSQYSDVSLDGGGNSPEGAGAVEFGSAGRPAKKQKIIP